MLLRLSLLAYPLLAAGILASRPGPVAKFKKAGATSPQLARRPSSLGIERVSTLEDSVHSGVIQQLPDGRCYVDLPVLRRRQRRVSTVVSIVGVAALVLYLLLAPK